MIPDSIVDTSLLLPLAAITELALQKHSPYKKDGSSLTNQPTNVIAQDSSRIALPMYRRRKLVQFVQVADCARCHLDSFVVKPPRRDVGHISPPRIDVMKQHPDMYRALLVGQLPDQCPSEAILAVLQHMLAQALPHHGPVIYAWDRFKPNCGALWVPAAVVNDVIAVLDCSARIDGACVTLYGDRVQAHEQALRRITCVVKNNVSSSSMQPRLQHMQSEALLSTTVMHC